MVRGNRKWGKLNSEELSDFIRLKVTGNGEN
jgi:hypothetical protein